MFAMLVRHLSYFVTLARECHFAKTAELKMIVTAGNATGGLEEAAKFNISA